VVKRSKQLTDFARRGLISRMSASNFFCPLLLAANIDILKGPDEF